MPIEGPPFARKTRHFERWEMDLITQAITEGYNSRWAAIKTGRTRNSVIAWAARHNLHFYDVRAKGGAARREPCRYG
jgi:hypothetical protein